MIQKNIGEDYPYYAKMLPQITSILFGGNGLGLFSINPAAFGELVIIIRHLEAEPNNAGIWNYVHPRIVKISKALYTDGHFDSAAEKAIKEVETRLREKFSELKPGVGVPSKIGDIIGALFSDNGIFQFCDGSNQSGKDHRKGISAADIFGSILYFPWLQASPPLISFFFSIIDLTGVDLILF